MSFNFIQFSLFNYCANYECNGYLITNSQCLVGMYLHTVAVRMKKQHDGTSISEREQ